jgi:hypothetical protein
MPIYKIQTTEEGVIIGIQEIYDYGSTAAGIEGYVVEDEILGAYLRDNFESFISSYYYDIENDLLLERPAITATPDKTSMLADGVDTVTITGLPVPCTIVIDETSYEVPDGSFAFSTTLAGTYIISIDNFPYLPISWEVTAT